MQFFADLGTQIHKPAFFLARGSIQSSPEVPERARVLSRALTEAGFSLRHGDEFDDEQTLAAILRVHRENYVRFLRTAWHRWQALPGAGPEIIPNVHPGRHTRGGLGLLNRDDTAADLESDHVVAEAGYYQADTACPIGEHTYAAALTSVRTALNGVAAIKRGDAPAAYALCRPPGHHCHADQAGGFCFLNNAAIAAQWLIDQGLSPVAVVDVDVHHGNGTQSIFYQRNDVLTASLHGHPRHFYPFYLGYSDECGIGSGEGYNLNRPLPEGTRDQDYLAELDHVLSRVHDYQPAALVVALGLDAAGDDPLAFFRITKDGFHAMGERLGALRLPTICVQEGGYLSPNLGINLTAFISGFMAGHG